MVIKTVRKGKRINIAGILSAIAILIVAGITAYYFISKENITQSAAAKQKAADFYTDFIYQINTNDDWAGFVDKYTVGDAKEDISAAALEILKSAENGSQYLVRLMSPIDAKTHEISGNSASVLVDFDLGERVVGDEENLSAVKKYLTLEKIGGDWFVSEIFDRSDRFDESISD
jgi:hypothetical protein